jgi:hypothetical protein
MKQITYILAFLILASCGQPNSEQNITTVSDVIILSDTATTGNYLMFDSSTIDEENAVDGEVDLDDWRKRSLSHSFEKATLYTLTDTIIADFNGDGIMDKAFFLKVNGISGIIIIHGQTNEEFRIGFGKPFAGMREFNWVDYWALVEDKETFEVTFDKKIFLSQDEGGGGLIAFMNGKYVWIHQTC